MNAKKDDDGKTEITTTIKVHQKAHSTKCLSAFLCTWQKSTHKTTE